MTTIVLLVVGAVVLEYKFPGTLGRLADFIWKLNEVALSSALKLMGLSK